MTKSGVAVEGKAAVDPANGKANGQVSASVQTHGTNRPPPSPAAWVAETRGCAALLVRPGCPPGRGGIHYCKDSYSIIPAEVR